MTIVNENYYKSIDYCIQCNLEWENDGQHFCQQCGQYAMGYTKTPIALLNTSIATADGTYRLSTVTLDQAKLLISDQDILSAIGHDSTAQILSDLLDADVPVNRIQFEQQPGQVALVFKLNGRPPEGKILSREEIEQIGYKFQILRREK